MNPSPDPRDALPPARLTAEGVLSEAECAELISWAEGIGFDSAPVTTHLGFLHMPRVRNNTRVMVDDPARAGFLWERVRAFLPEELGPWRVLGLNERLRVYRYGPGQFFRSHFDGAFQRGPGERSQYTLMVYLNEDFEGGGTSFGSEVVTPATGKLLAFLHRQRHQGDEVSRGVKYVLRTDVMYRRG